MKRLRQIFLHSLVATLLGTTLTACGTPGLSSRPSAMPTATTPVRTAVSVQTMVSTPPAEGSATPTMVIVPTIVDAQPAQPIIGFEPKGGPPGTEVAVWGSGYTPNAPVAVRIGLPQAVGEVLASAIADAKGSWRVSLVFPDRLPSGDPVSGDNVRLVAMDEQNKALASAPFRFVAPVEPGPGLTLEGASETVRQLLGTFRNGDITPYLSAKLRSELAGSRTVDEALGLYDLPLQSFDVRPPEDRPSEMLFVRATLHYPNFVEERIYELVVEDGQWRVGGSAKVDASEAPVPPAECEPSPHQSKGSVNVWAPFCVVWEDTFDDERGFRIEVQYLGQGGEAFTYEAGPDQEQFAVPVPDRPRINESRELCQRRGSYAIKVVALRPSGEELVGGMAMESECMMGFPPATPTLVPQDESRAIGELVLTHLRPAQEGKGVLVGAIAVDGDFAAALALPQGDRPIYAFLQRDGAGWDVIEATSIPSGELLREKGIPESIMQTSEASVIVDNWMGQLQDPRGEGANGYVVVEAIAGDYARVGFTPADPQTRDGFTAFLHREGERWSQLTAGTTFDRESLGQLGIPQGLWPAQ